MLDENEFFRNATLRICGNLNIEAGLKDCFDYISQHIPADRIYLERHEYELGAMRIVARADAGVGERINVLIPYNEPAKQAMLEAAKEGRHFSLRMGDQQVAGRTGNEMPSGRAG